MSEVTSAKCPVCGVAMTESTPLGLCPACLLAQGVATQTAMGKTGGDVPFALPALEELAAKFPQLEIIELIGHGGMGAVYKARQKELDRFIALKILPPGIGEAPGFAERFAREAKALAKLNHPGIVTVHDFGRADGLYFFLMEYVDGVNLRQLLHRGRVSPREALAIVPQICDALQFAHDHRIVHRDIKPENILLDRRGRVKVADFGLAKLVEAGAESLESTSESPAQNTLTDAGKILGTPSYMAPEQTEHPDEVDHRADIYALGVVFYQMLTGELPGKSIEPPSRKVHIDVRLDEVVLRALQRSPEMRFQQVSVLKTQVETIAASAPAADRKMDLNTERSGGEWDRPIAPAASREPGWIYALASLWALAGLVLLIGRKVMRTEPMMYSLLGLSGWFYPFTYNLLWVACFGVALLCLVAPRRAQLVHLVQRGVTARTLNTEPRFSRMAMAGAFWASFFLFFLVPAFLWFWVTPATIAISNGATRAIPAWWQIALRITLLPVGLTAPFGTTILGWVAVAKIRRSAGRLYGLGLAVFDGLLFPLLALNGFILWLAMALRRVFVDFYANPALQNRPEISPEAATRLANFLSSQDTLIIPGAVVVALAADYLIIRRVWRAVNPPTERPQTDPSPTASRRPLLWPRLLAVAAVLLGIGLGGALWLQRPRLLDNALTSKESPDGMFIAHAMTLSAMSIGDQDRTFYRFSIQRPGGADLWRWEINAPVEKLSEEPRAWRLDELSFQRHGRIHWSKDGRLVSFQIRGVEVSAFDVTRGIQARFAASSRPLPGNGPEEVADYSNREITEEHIAELLRKPRLKRLNLDDSSVGDEHLARLAALQELEYVTLSATRRKTSYKPKVTDAGLAGVAQWRRLQTLYLVGNPISDEGLKKLWSLPELRALQLADTVISGDGLAGFKNLEWLRLDATMIADDALRHLAGLALLEQLYLDGCPRITDAGIKHLTALEKLRVLNVHGTKVTARGLNELKAVIPGVSIGADVALSRANAGAPRFSPTLERVITLDHREDSFLRLSTGEFVPPQGIDPAAVDADPANSPLPHQLWKWLADRDVDLFVQRKDGRPLLAMSDMVIAVIDEKEFDRLSPAQLHDHKGLRAAMDAPIRPRVQSVMRGAFGGKVTVAFRTRYDVTGLLQVEDVQSNPPGMRIRYKLLHREGADAAAAGSTFASPPGVAGFLPERRHSMTAHQTLQNCFLDFDSGRILSAPKELTDSLRAKGQLNDGRPQAAAVAEWMRQSGADWMKREDESGLVQIDGRNAIMAEMRPEQNGASRFNTLTPDEMVRALDAQPEPPSTGAHPLWGISPGRVVAFRTREGAIGVAEVLPEPPGSATTQLRYKLVQQPQEAPAKSVRSSFPKAAHTGDGKRTALLHHDDVDLHYALFHTGDFGSTVSDSHNTRSQAWTDAGSLTLKNGQAFSYKRDSKHADRLRIEVAQHGGFAAHGETFDLRRGKVLVLHNNGFVEQLPLYPPLAEARDLTTLDELVTRRRGGNATTAWDAPLSEMGK